MSERKPEVVIRAQTQLHVVPSTISSEFLPVLTMNIYSEKKNKQIKITDQLKTFHFQALSSSYSRP